MDLINVLQLAMDKERPLQSLDRKEEIGVYLNPSSSSVYTKDGTPLGTCAKQIWLSKKGYPISRPSNSYNKFNQEIGKMIEKWVINKFKDAGIYLDSNVKLVDNELNLSGEIDVLCVNPETQTQFVVEIKSYNASLFNNSSSVLGTKDSYPTPKDGYILQVVTYLLLLKRYNINEVRLLYVDKSAKSLYNCKEFIFFLKGDEIYYKTYHQGKLITLKEDRFGVQDILDKNNFILKMIEDDIVPEPDYKMVFNEEDVELAYQSGEISKSKYEKIKKEQSYSDVGSWQCQYCQFGKNTETGESTCINITNETKDFYGR